MLEFIWAASAFSWSKPPPLPPPLPPPPIAPEKIAMVKRKNHFLRENGLKRIKDVRAMLLSIIVPMKAERINYLLLNNLAIIF
jgi:hypothetical protein|tara:strand:+ start:499 stop:747 length:249 start_codon:yes stop_codon:yes gene_type:complete